MLVIQVINIMKTITFNIISHNFYTLTLILKLKKTIFVNHHNYSPNKSIPSPIERPIANVNRDEIGSKVREAKRLM